MADRRLVVWTLASFHTVGFTLAFVTPAYASGGLSDALPNFGTLPGVLGYGYLWGLSYLATRWVLTEDVLAETVAGSPGSVLVRGSVAGGFVGMATLLGPLLLVTVPDLVTGGGNATSLLLITAIGAGVATVVGLLVGLLFTLLDVAAVRVAGSLVPE